MDESIQLLLLTYSGSVFRVIEERTLDEKRPMVADQMHTHQFKKFPDNTVDACRGLFYIIFSVLFLSENYQIAVGVTLSLSPFKRDDR